MTETALGQSLHLETLYGALSIFDAIIVTGRKGDGSLGIVSIESVETSASGSSTLTAYQASSGEETLADTALSAKLALEPEPGLRHGQWPSLPLGLKTRARP